MGLDEAQLDKVFPNRPRPSGNVDGLIRAWRDFHSFVVPAAIASLPFQDDGPMASGRFSLRMKMSVRRLAS